SVTRRKPPKNSSPGPPTSTLSSEVSDEQHNPREAQGCTDVAAPFRQDPSTAGARYDVRVDAALQRLPVASGVPGPVRPGFSGVDHDHRDVSDAADHTRLPAAPTTDRVDGLPHLLANDSGRHSGLDTDLPTGDRQEFGDQGVL